MGAIRKLIEAAKDVGQAYTDVCRCSRCQHLTEAIAVAERELEEEVVFTVENAGRARSLLDMAVGLRVGKGLTYAIRLIEPEKPRARPFRLRPEATSQTQRARWLCPLCEEITIQYGGKPDPDHCLACGVVWGEPRRLAMENAP